MPPFPAIVVPVVRSLPARLAVVVMLKMMGVVTVREALETVAHVTAGRVAPE
jgi:hypothetical protein